MIGAIFREGFYWVIDLIEVLAVVIAILLIGLVVAFGSFWALSRSLNKLAGRPAELDSDENELDQEVAGQGVSIRRDEDSPPPELGA